MIFGCPQTENSEKVVKVPEIKHTVHNGHHFNGTYPLQWSSMAGSNFPEEFSDPICHWDPGGCVRLVAALKSDKTNLIPWRCLDPVGWSDFFPKILGEAWYQKISWLVGSISEDLCKVSSWCFYLNFRELSLEELRSNWNLIGFPSSRLKTKIFCKEAQGQNKLSPNCVVNQILKLYRSTLSKGFNSSILYIYGFLFQLEIDLHCKVAVNIWSEFSMTSRNYPHETNTCLILGILEPNNSCLFSPISISFLLEKQKPFEQTHHFYHLFVTATFRRKKNQKHQGVSSDSVYSQQPKTNPPISWQVSPLLSYEGEGLGARPVPGAKLAKMVRKKNLLHTSIVIHKWAELCTIDWQNQPAESDKNTWAAFWHADFANSKNYCIYI